LGFRVWGLGLGVWDLGFRIWGLGFGVWYLGFGVWGLDFWLMCWRVERQGAEDLRTGRHKDLRLRVKGYGFRV